MNDAEGYPSDDALSPAIRVMLCEALPTIERAASMPTTEGASSIGEAYIAVRDAPGFEAFVKAFKADPQMLQLAPLLPSAHGVFWQSPEGGGWRDDQDSAALGVVLRAVQAAALEKEELTLDSLAARVEGNVRALRRALEGRSIDVASAVVIANLRLEPAQRIETSLGVIAQSPSSELGATLEGFGKAIYLNNYSGKLSWTVAADPIGQWSSRDFTGQRKTDRTLLQLAFHLAGTTIPIFHFQSLLWPFTPWVSGSMTSHEELRQDEGGGYFAVSEEQWQAIIGNAQLLVSGYHPSFRVAYVRIVRARLAARFDKSSALVDAVIAWESMFGTRNESTFRVTGALSHLLEPDPHLRIDFQRRLKKIYGLRSRVVHGDDLDSEIEGAAADEALDVATRALASLHALPASFRARSSEERSSLLMLGAPLI